MFTKADLNKKYYEVFSNKTQAYLKQKENFVKRGYGQLFYNLFRVQESEERLNSVSIAATIESELLWLQNEGKIVVK